MDYINLGKKIRNRRNELSLSQEKLAEMAGVTPSYIGQIERAERKLSLETLVNISNSLCVTIDFLLNDSLIFNKDVYMEQINKLLINKSSKVKKTVIDIIRALLIHVE